MRNWTLIAGVVAGMALSAPAYAQQKVVNKLTPQDYAEIQQLYARYAWSIDTHAENGMVYANTFTPDGEFQVGDNKVIGRERLAPYNLTMGVANRAPTHFNMNLVVEPLPEGARGRVYLLIVGAQPDAPPKVSTIGTYQDILVKTAEGWRFKQKKLYLNAMPPASSASN